MKPGSLKVFAREDSRAGEDKKGVVNSRMPLRPFLPSAETFRNGARTPRRARHSVTRSHSSGRGVAADTAAFVSRCFPKTIKIPARFRDLPLEALSDDRKISVRLAHVLRRSGARILGDVDGRRIGDFAWKKNCGLKTLEELDSLGSLFSNQPTSASRGTTTSRTPFAIPKPVCGLRFEQLPITKRLANVVYSNGLRILGDLQGRTPFEVLQYQACGWRTLAEIHQLIERAIGGEFRVARINESRAAAELLTLLEEGVARLAPRDRQFLLARLHGMTFAEIGRRHGLTRARVHQAVVKALGILRKTWGPRIPRLLEMMRAHCVSIPNGSRPTPALLERLVGDASKSVSLSPEARLRLIAALDKNTPCELETAKKGNSPPNTPKTHKKRKG